MVGILYYSIFLVWSKKGGGDKINSQIREKKWSDLIFAYFSKTLLGLIFRFKISGNQKPKIKFVRTKHRLLSCHCTTGE